MICPHIISMQSALEFYVTVKDDDLIDDDEIDEFIIPVNKQLRANSEFSSRTTYFGSCGRASIDVSFRIISLCQTNTYGPQCNLVCIEKPDQNTCNYLGEPICLNNYAPPNCDECITGFQSPGCTDCVGHFKEPDCTECDQNFQGRNCDVCTNGYFPEGACNVFCVPRNDSGGHFRCDPVTGEKICLEGYEDPLSNCVKLEQGV